MLFFRLAWREIRKRPGRALLTLSSIVIGVAAVIAVSFTTQTTHQAFTSIFETVAGRASLEVTGPVNTAFDEEVLERVKDVPGVAAVSPMIQRPMAIFAEKEPERWERARLTALGIDLELDRAVHDYELVDGNWFDKEHPGVVLNQAFAKNIGAKVGTSIEIVTPYKGRVSATVQGFFESRNTATTGQGGVMLAPLKFAQVANKAPGKLDIIQIVTEPNADLDAVRNEIAARLPEGVTVRPPAARSALAEQASVSTQQALRIARIFAVAAAFFIIINTFLISVTQRRRQLGIMRAIGATQGQIAKLVFTEAIVLGIVGTIIGCVAGYLAATYLLSAMGSLYATKLPAIQLLPTPFYLAAAFGIGVSLIGAAFPAFKASRLSPLDAMREVLAVELEGVSRWIVASGAMLIMVAVWMLAAAILGLRSPAWAIWGALLLLAGFVGLLPVVLRPLSWLSTAAMRPWMRVEGRLARRELLRHRVRTTLTAGVVFFTVATGIGLTSAVTDNVANVKNWYHKAIVADFFVRALAPDMATGLAADLPEDLDPKIRQVEGIKSLEAIRFVSATAVGESIVLVVRDFDGSHELEFDLVGSELAGVRDKLMQGEVIIGSPLAQKAKLKVGDEIPLDVGNSEMKFRIAAIANDYNAGGLTIYLERNIAKRLLNVEGIDAYIIRVDRTRLEEVRKSLEGLRDEYGVMLQSFSDIQATIDGMMSGVVAGLWGMVVLGLVVAAFGVANTLMITVFEQTRELGLLRILAMTRMQVRKSILAQALTMGLVALIPGIAAGVGVAYLINWATYPVIGHMIPFAIHPELLFGSAAVGLVLVIAAAWVPAERAARLELPVALRYT